MASQHARGQLRVCVIGAGGYVGGELLEILGRHPAVAQTVACSPSRAGSSVGATHPQLQGRSSLSFAAEPAAPGDCDAVFFATPPRVAMEQARPYLDAGCVVVDCSPDFRLQDLDRWSSLYGGPHTEPDLVEQAVYGLVELRRQELGGAKLIAVPGCYATVVQLAAAPAVKALAAAGAQSVEVFAACVSGTSGAGRQTGRGDLLLAEAGDNFKAYALGGHRHAPEIVQGIERHAQLAPALSFIPHLLPVPRGMFATLHLRPDALSGEETHAALAQTYADEPFIDVLPLGVSPQLAAVRNSNRCQLGCTEAGAVLGAIDNLGKGAAGQAVQAWNVAAGLPETSGLDG